MTLQQKEGRSVANRFLNLKTMKSLGFSAAKRMKKAKKDRD